MKLENYLDQEQLNKILQENFKKLLLIINKIEEIEHGLIEIRIKTNKFPGYEVEVDNPIKYSVDYALATYDLEKLFEMGKSILINLYDNCDEDLANLMLTNKKYRSMLKHMLQLLDK